MIKLKNKHRFYIASLISAAAVLTLFIYLYNSYIIFVKNVEHGLIVNKTNYGSGYKYEVYINGREETLISKDKSINLNNGVANFKQRGSTIVKLINYVEPINEKIMSRSPTSLDLEYSGAVKLSDKINIYKAKGSNISVEKTGAIMVGAGNIMVYKDKNAQIKTVIINGDTDLNFIRVGIRNLNFESRLHDRLDFTSNGSMSVEDKIARKLIEFPAKSKITLTPQKDGISVTSDEGTVTFKNRLYILPPVDGSLITITTFKRSYGSPSYRGSFEVTISDGKLKLINEVGMESYLLQVVPSEMPSSFGLEALKAQAVAARTYAVSGLFSNTFASEGYHLDDSTLSQVYNNYSENSLASKAVSSTKGLVMKYEGELVNAVYYSTSHGYGANAGDIWAVDGKLPGINKPYLTARSYLINSEEYNLSSEKDAESFFKNWNLKSYDSASPYFRWKVTMSKDELRNTIEKNLPIVYEDQKDFIFTQDGNKFVSRRIPECCLGDLTDLRVAKRGEGGNIMELIISGTKGTYKIVKELNVRYVIRPGREDTLSDRDILLKRSSGHDIKNASLLPSAFMVFDIDRDMNKEIKTVTIYGGGYGHSVGMSQYGASYLSSKGYTFDRILQTYYKDITLEKLY